MYDSFFFMQVLQPLCDLFDNLLCHRLSHLVSNSSSCSILPQSIGEEKVSEIAAITILHYYIIKLFSTILADELYNPFIFHFWQQLHLIENIIKISKRETFAGVASYLFDSVVFSFYLNPIDLCKISFSNRRHWSGVLRLINRLFIKKQLISWFLSQLSL
jgi:hypothetical protein